MNKYMKASFNSGFIGYALAQYEEEQLRNLKSMEKYRGIIEDPTYRDASPTFKERMVVADQMGMSLDNQGL
jgi:hypothetical protein|tara:strand:- start:79 stop:291 length:213 start_codon:yes stop_codon:yes gene_type:complete